MANNVEDVVVASNGSVFVAAVGAAEPTSPTASYSGSWTDIGFISENGVQDSTGRTITDINAWQSFYPIRQVVTAITKKITFAMREWKTDNIIFAFGGGSVSGGQYTPPQPQDINETAMGVDWSDGDKHYRLILRRGVVSDNVDTTLSRAAAADLSIGYTLLGPPVGITDAWILLTDDPAFSPGS
jgi:hypothetical protein